MSPRKSATAVGDQGLSSCSTVETVPFGAILRTLPQPLAATNTVPDESTVSPRRIGSLGSLAGMRAMRLARPFTLLATLRI